jgi:branched-chain amino acid transport system substrate-binding protein
VTRLSAALAVTLLALVLLALVLLGIAAGATDATPGVTSRSILLGSSGPLTGEAASAASVLRGAEAYFKYVNARGGVYGRKITLRYYDDGSDPTQAELNARRLIEDDQVLALFSTVGTSGNLAIRPIANAAAVPQLFVASAASTFGRDYRQYPYTVGYSPTHSEEGQVFARYLLATAGKRSKIGVLYQNDSDGKELVAGLEKGLGTSRTKIVAKVPYEPTAADIQPELAELKASGANTLMVFAFDRFAPQAAQSAFKLGWKPQLYVGGDSPAPATMRSMPQATAEGAISIAFAKDPDAPAFAGDDGVALGSSIVKRYVPGGNPRDGALIAGMASAFTMVDALKKAGRTPTRESLLRAATRLSEANNPFLVPGIVVRTSATSRFPITQVKLQRWHRGHWQPLGGLVSVKA